MDVRWPRVKWWQRIAPEASSSVPTMLALKVR
jgi:hypothetical protein